MNKWTNQIKQTCKDREQNSGHHRGRGWVKTKEGQLYNDRWKLGLPGGSDFEESACNVGDLGLIPGLGRSPGGGHGNPLQYSCLENRHGQRSPGNSLCSWDFPHKNAGMGCHPLLQGIFQTQRLNPGLPRCRQILYHLSHQGSPKKLIILKIKSL